MHSWVWNTCVHLMCWSMSFNGCIIVYFNEVPQPLSLLISFIKMVSQSDTCSLSSFYLPICIHHGDMNIRCMWCDCRLKDLSVTWRYCDSTTPSNQCLSSVPGAAVESIFAVQIYTTAFIINTEIRLYGNFYFGILNLLAPAGRYLSLWIHALVCDYFCR